MSSHQPAAPLPEPLRANETGTFTEHSVKVRLPDIARRTLADNDFPPSVVARFEALIADIPAARIRPLHSHAAPDAAAWEAYIEPYTAYNWLDVPWFFAETYFYRRIMEAVDYFGRSDTRGPDPFLHQKRQGLRTSSAAIAELTAQLDEVLAESAPGDEQLAQLFSVSLWGNQADLSLWPADADDAASEGVAERPTQRENQDDQMVSDHRETAIAHLQAGRQKMGDSLRVDMILDNAGLELVGDLCLVDLLLSGGWATEMHLHAKLHPTFVSDALIRDVLETIDALADEAAPGAQRLAARLRQHLDDGRLHLTFHPFWNSPLPMWQMPEDLRTLLRPAHLVISKGDANYRRILGDSHWPFTTPFGVLAAPLPAPIVALRTLKAPTVVGLREGQSVQLDALDREWITNGQWGLIQFGVPAT